MIAGLFEFLLPLSQRRHVEQRSDNIASAVRDSGATDMREDVSSPICPVVHDGLAHRHLASCQHPVIFLDIAGGLIPEDRLLIAAQRRKLAGLEEFTFDLVGIDHHVIFVAHENRNRQRIQHCLIEADLVTLLDQQRLALLAVCHVEPQADDIAICQAPVDHANPSAGPQAIGILIIGLAIGFETLLDPSFASCGVGRVNFGVEPALNPAHQDIREPLTVTDPPHILEIELLHLVVDEGNPALRIQDQNASIDMGERILEDR